MVKISPRILSNPTKVGSGSSDNGARVQVWEDNGTGAQRWVLRKIDVNASWSPWIIQNAASGSKPSSKNKLSFEKHARL